MPIHELATNPKSGQNEKRLAPTCAGVGESKFSDLHRLHRSFPQAQTLLNLNAPTAPTSQCDAKMLPLPAPHLAKTRQSPNLNCPTNSTHAYSPLATSPLAIRPAIRPDPSRRVKVAARIEALPRLFRPCGRRAVRLARGVSIVSREIVKRNGVQIRSSPGRSNHASCRPARVHRLPTPSRCRCRRAH